MNDRSKSCEERIGEELACEMERVSEALASKEVREEYIEGPLEISVQPIKVRIGLSCGGPSDGFYIYVNPIDGEIVDVEYYYADWYDGAERKLLGEDKDAVIDLLGYYAQSAAVEVKNE